MNEPRVLRIELPGLPVLTANDRPGHYARAKKMREIKAQAGEAVKGAEPFPGKVRIRAVYSPPNRHERDPDNIFLTAKACIDALVPSVIPADSSRVVSEVCCAIADRVVPGGLFVVQVIEDD